MVTSQSNVPSVLQHFRRLRGGSQANLVLASDGLPYVLKFANNLQGPNLLFNEGAGSELFRALGLATPDWQPIQLSTQFINRNPACWINAQHGSLRPQPGLCFGSRFLGLNGVRALEILPGSHHRRIQNRNQFWLAWLVDICATHTDNRQALFTEDAHGLLSPFFLDHGSLFGGPNGQESRHFLASRYLDHRIYPALDPATRQYIEHQLLNLNTQILQQRILALPETWNSDSALKHFQQTLERLAQPRLIENLLDTIHASVQQKASAEGELQQSVPGCKFAILYPGVHPQRPEVLRQAKRSHHPARH